MTIKDKLVQFIDNLNGQFVEVSYQPAEYQCMDLAYNWIFCLDFPKSTIQHQYAYEVYTQASDFTRKYFDIIPNKLETIPQEGDLVVWNKTSGNIAGHIAIVVEATQTKMKVFEQNSPLGTNAHIGDKSYTNVLGFLRPILKDVSTTPQYLLTLFQEAGLKIEDEGEVRSFWQKAIKYDDDVKSLQEQVKSANEALADRALEVSVLTEKNQKLSDKVSEIEEINNKLRSENDKIAWEKTGLEIENKKLQEELASLSERVEKLENDNSIHAYSWWTRFVSLWKRG
jgi:FtsZ-binding cell division protein ZapB